ncbi:hypothetical protein F5B18DRAFT_617739 [Nemania serpens]|nr:hypothetical protein F5B18DRAFT_617739 [Nemania serpens]
MMTLRKLGIFLLVRCALVYTRLYYTHLNFLSHFVTSRSKGSWYCVLPRRDVYFLIMYVCGVLFRLIPGWLIPIAF